jgi:dethiobiotin synthetase
MRAASSLSVPGGFDNPYALPDAVSPHIAARRAGAVIDLDHIEACFHALRQHADAVVVEGAGGFIVPLCEPDPDLGGDWVTSADLAQRFNLPIILTVGRAPGLHQPCAAHAGGHPGARPEAGRLGGQRGRPADAGAGRPTWPR